MSAFGELVIMNEVDVCLLRPAPRRCIDFVREGTDGDWEFDAPYIEEATFHRKLRSIPVEPCGGNSGACQPVKCDVVQNIVPRQSFRFPIEDPCDHFLASCIMVEHPGRQPD